MADQNATCPRVFNWWCNLVTLVSNKFHGDTWCEASLANGGRKKQIFIFLLTRLCFNLLLMCVKKIFLFWKLPGWSEIINCSRMNKFGCLEVLIGKKCILIWNLKKIKVIKLNLLTCVCIPLSFQTLSLSLSLSPLTLFLKMEHVCA